ncbi:type II toxin-antitoxin system RelE/ParE family toxin [Peptoniphilus sp. MSJ-1]|uniref:Type II toxin-antitoxin system RelE/ParE family toxin n=1 Tax=Peptoniphilus ovalis TaxID=2841503 RepID=A0ABS6FIY9_9FIRM|nr:type II toxin-antitoxin system RelE/ParE family toxin [Peptoniphilus ovalis]MBU5670147.1 type II toxin-antitoxin system RelE/ParE family toxin [Peptoniphilus ovalis]
MESYNILLSDLAIQDIIDIKTYISIELGELEVSEGIVQSIYDSIYNLSYMPERFRKYDGIKEKNIKICPVKKYLIFYEVDNIVKNINVIRVLYSSRNFKNLL